MKDTDLCSGPAKLTQALRIDGKLDRLDLVNGKGLYLERGKPIPEERIVTATRIGVAYAQQWAKKPLRFYVARQSQCERSKIAVRHYLRGGSSLNP